MRRQEPLKDYFVTRIFDNFVVSSKFSMKIPQIAINLPSSYEKLHCKGIPYQFSGQRDPLVQTERQTDILLLYYKDIL